MNYCLRNAIRTRIGRSFPCAPTSVTASVTLAIALAFGISDGAAATNINYAPAAGYGVAAGPKKLAVGDFNRDGWSDVAVAGQTGGVVSVLLGASNGTLGSAVNYAAGNLSYSVAVADINGDGKSDLAVGNLGSQDIAVLMGNGNGTFATAVNHALGTSPWAVTVGDVNGDGKPDLISSNHDSNNVSVLLNTGAGTFAAPVTYPVGSGPVSVTAADLNGDGKLDLAAVNVGSHDISILLGTGGGAFGLAANFATGNGPRQAAVGDFNNDGKQDIATANELAGNVSVLLGNGAGSFGSAVQYATQNAPHSLAAVDLDRNGSLDLAVANTNSNSVSLLSGAADGTFDSAQNYATGIAPFHLESADFNRDGYADLVTSDMNANSVSVLLNKQLHRSAEFGASATFAAGSGSTRCVAWGDFNNDGKADMVTGSAGTNFSILMGTGPGTFAARVNYSTVGVAEAMAVHDFNGDGFADVLIGSSNAIRIHYGRGNGTFGNNVAGDTYKHDQISAGFTNVGIADFNKDGKPDFAANVSGSNDFVSFLNTGNGQYSATSFPHGTDYTLISTLTTADLNADGNPDVITTARSGMQAVVAWLGDGLGGFSKIPNSYSAAFQTPTGMVAGDFNSDGRSDVAITFTSHIVAVYFNNGDANATLTYSASYPVGNNPRNIVKGDFNGDGNLDLATANADGNNVSVLQNTGAGAFASAVNYSGSGADKLGLAVGDLTGDGRTDLVVTNRLASSVTLLPNIGGQFSLPTESVAPGTVGNAATEAMLKIIATHNGLVGEGSIALTDFHFGFDEGSGIPLTTSQLGAVIAGVAVYSDSNSNGSFDAGTDTQLASFSAPALDGNGRAFLSLPAANPGFVISQGTPKSYFLVITTAANAGAQTPNAVRITHITSASSKAVDSVTNAPVLLTSTTDVSTPSGGTPLPISISAFSVE